MGQNGGRKLPYTRARRGNPAFYGGQRYRSTFEADVAEAMDEAGIPWTYEESRFPYETPHVYTPDFSLPGKVYVECKGYFPAIDRKKLLAVKRANPDLDIRILFQDASRTLLPRNRAPTSRTYGQWATANGFIWAEGRVPPRSWVRE